MAHEKAESHLPVPGSTELLRRLHLQAVVPEHGGRPGRLSRPDIGLRAAAGLQLDDPQGLGRPLPSPQAPQGPPQEFGRLGVLLQLEAELAGSLERLKLAEECGGSIQIPRALGRLGSLELVPSFLKKA